MVSVILLAAVVAFAAQNYGPEKFDLNGGDKGDVPFPHHQHQNALKDCSACHDVFPKARESIDDMKAKQKLKAKQVMNKVCIKCHNEKKMAGEKTGPITCSQCHIK